MRNEQVLGQNLIDVSLKKMDYDAVLKVMRSQAVSALHDAQENNRDLTLIRETFPHEAVIGLPRASERRACDLAIKLHDYIRKTERGDCIMLCGSKVEPRILVSSMNNTALYKGASGMNEFLNDYQDFVS